MLWEREGLVILMLSLTRSPSITKPALTVQLYPVQEQILTSKRETSSCGAAAELPPMQVVLMVEISELIAIFWWLYREKTAILQLMLAQLGADKRRSMYRRYL